jgi:hypothetical protein
VCADRAVLSEATQWPPIGVERMLRIYFCSSGSICRTRRWKRRSTIRLRCAALSVSAVAGGENVRRATWWSCDPCPGLGRIILAVPLAKVWQALRWGDYRALRTLSGVAPLTWRQAELAQSVLDRASIVLSLR